MAVPSSALFSLASDGNGMGLAAGRGGGIRGQSRCAVQVTRIATPVARTSAYVNEAAIERDSSATTGIVVRHISMNNGPTRGRPAAIAYSVRNTITAATPNRSSGVGSN